MNSNHLKAVGLIATIAILLVAVIVAGCSTQQASTSPVKETETPVSSPATKTITDLADRTVEIPGNVTRVACLVGPSYEKVFMLGQKDRIALRTGMKRPWALLVNPDLEKIPTTSSAQDPNVEDLIEKNVQVVFFWDYPLPVQKMTDAGITVVSTQSTRNVPDTIEGFIEFEKKEVQLFGEVLGPAAMHKADEYCTYFDEKVRYVTSRVAKIPAGERPNVYYVRGPDALTTHGRNSYTQYWVEMAGGIMVSRDTEMEGLQQVSIEQVLNWNPDVIFMGRLDSTDAVMNDPKWSSVKAVKDGRVYVNPDGVMYWDYSSEGVLLMMFIAKTLHPDIFEDLDLVKEVKEFYRRFYGYELTDDQANRLLKRLPPV